MLDKIQKVTGIMFTLVMTSVCAAVGYLEVKYLKSELDDI